MVISTAPNPSDIDKVKTILAIDGGGSRTRTALIGETGNICGDGAGGTSNPYYAGLDGLREQIGNSVQAAFASAGTPREPVSAVCMGLAGAGIAEPNEEILRAIAPLHLAPRSRIEICNDLIIALAGGLAGNPGIIIIAGTGSACLGVNDKGRHVNVGGWGHLVDDDGSGYSMAIRAMRACVKAEDGRGAATSLSAKLIEFFALSNPRDLIELLYRPGLSRDRIASFAPIVIQSAENGDNVATGIVGQCAHDLAALAKVANDRLSFKSPVAITIAGGLADSGPPFSPLLLGEIRKQIPGCAPTEPVLPPIGGAALRALGMIGVDPRPAIIKNLQQLTNLFEDATTPAMERHAGWNGQ